VIRIGVLTPHVAVGPEEEFAAMAPAQLTTRVVRISADPPDHAITAARSRARLSTKRPRRSQSDRLTSSAAPRDGYDDGHSSTRLT
jgi:hypothetical protein